MVKYRIPIAEFLAAGLIGTCFVIALIMINMQVEDRGRRTGASGVTMVLLSMVIEALNRSVAGAYGTDTTLYVVASIAVGLLAGGGLVLIAIAIMRSGRLGRSRSGP